MSLEERCGTCGNPQTLLDAISGGPCLECVKARHRSVLAQGRCVCRTKRHLGDPVTVGGIVINGVKRGGRRFRPCSRCLGHVNLPDPAPERVR